MIHEENIKTFDELALRLELEAERLEATRAARGVGSANIVENV